MSAETSQALGSNTLSAGETWTSDMVAGRIAEWESFWAEEPVLMPAGHPRVVGRANITHYVTREFSAGMSYRFTEWSYTGRDDLAMVTNQIELDAEGATNTPMAVFN